MAAAVAGYRTSLGSDGPPTCYDDIDRSDCMVIWGSNMAEAHPVTFDRIKARRKADPRVELIVVDPRRTPTAAPADLHVPVAPGRRHRPDERRRLAAARARRARPRLHRRHTAGFDEYRRFLLASDWDELCLGVGRARPRGPSRWPTGSPGLGLLSFYCMGLNQSTVGMWKNNSLINLHLLTGQIGKPGAGPFCLTGQPNAMGGREAGLLAHQLPGYRFVDDPSDRASVERYWGRPPGTISPRSRA